MWAVIYGSADLVGMPLGIPRRGKNDLETSTGRWTEQFAPRVRARPGFDDPPTVLLGVSDRFTNVLVGMVLRHGSLASP